MSLIRQTSLSGVGTSVVFGAYFRGFFGDGVLSVQITGLLTLVCLYPFLQRAWKSLPRPLMYAFATTATLGLVLPCFYALIMNLFTGHRKAGATPFDAIWRIFAILVLWICFAKLNEEYIRPALRDVPFFQRATGSVAQFARNSAMGKREKALEAIKARLVPVVIRRKKAEKLIAEKGPALTSAEKNIERSKSLFQKGETRLAATSPGSAEHTDLKEEVDGLKSMVENAEAYGAALKSQIADAEAVVKECTETGEKLQLEWTEALHIENHVEFYR